MTDIFREVDEEVRRAQVERIWSRYGMVIVALAVAVVLAVAGYQFYRWQERQTAEALGARFEGAIAQLRENRLSEAEAAFAAIGREGNGTYAKLAQIRAALIQAERDPAAGIAALDAIAGHAAEEPALRDLVRMRAAILASATVPFADLERRLQPLTAAASSVRFSALELLGAAALKAGETTKAQAAFDSIIIDAAAPAQVRARAELLIGLTRGR